ncbi:MAG: hypothetical protein ACLFPM_02610 [Candidatus Izemoplasmatales bacterium]
MKTLRNIGLVVIFAALAWLIVGYAPKDDVRASELEMIHEMSYSDTVDGNLNWTEKTYENKGLTIYVNEIRNSHTELKASRESVIDLLDDLKQLKITYEENNIQLSEEDQAIIRESYQKLRFYRFMLKDTIGQGYPQLIDLRENKDIYTREQSKEILIEVYLVLQSRITIFNNIQMELTNIQNILEQY